MAQTPTALDQSKWKLLEVRGTGLTLPEGRAVTLTFSDGAVVARGCNIMRSNFTVEGGKLVAGPMVSGRRACSEPGMKLDEAIGALLTGVAYRIDGDRLTLTGGDGSEWVFAKQPMPSKDAKTKFIYVASETKDCSAGAGRMKCLQIRESKDEPWRLNYTPIIGFVHQPGTEYRLRIKEDVRANVPQDASRYIWYLDLVVERKKVATP